MGLLLVGIAVIGVALVAALVFAPLFTWQTAAIALVFDQYELGTLEPVPFAAEDRKGLGESLAGLLDTRLGREIVDLSGLESAEGLLERLLPRMRRLPLRSKDVLISYVRGQAIVAPRFPDAAEGGVDALAGRACFLASDLAFSGPRIRELVPVREIVESIGAAPPYVTLHVLDLGDITWDPRLGVMANCVSRALDTDFAAPQQDARYHNWILGSHDLFQHSAVSFPGRCTYFGHAVKLALGGEADAAPCGDGDGLVELHEVVAFVSSWTPEWVRRATGGRLSQRPILWKLGVGRVAAADVPTNVPLVRLAGKAGTKPRDPDSVSGQGGAADGGANRPATAVPPDDSQANPSPPSGGPQANPAAPGTQQPPAAAPPAPDAKPATPAPAGPSPAVKPAAAAETLPAPPGADAKPPTASAPSAEAGAPADALQLAAPGGAPSAPPPAAPPVQTPPAQTAPAQTVATPEEPPPPVERPTDPWRGLTLLGRRSSGATSRQSLDSGEGPLPTPLDFEPHHWTRAFALVASADVRRSAIGPLAERSDTAFRQSGIELGTLWFDLRTGQTDPRPQGAGQASELLPNAAEVGRAFAERWATSPPVFTNALAARNDAIMTIGSISDVTGRISGGASTPAIDPARVRSLISKVAQLTTAIRRYAGSAERAGDDRLGPNPMETATRTARAETAMLAELLQKISRSSGAAGPILERSSFGGVVATLRSPVISAADRDAIRASLILPRPGAVKPPEADRSMPPIAEGGMSFDTRALTNIADRCLEITSLVEASVGSDATRAAGSIDLRELNLDIAEIRVAAGKLVQTAFDQRQALERVTALGGLVARMYARIAGLSRGVNRDDTVASDTVDDVATGLLRIVDPRDVADIDRSVSASLPPFRRRGRSVLAFSPTGDVRLSLTQPVEGRLTVSGDKAPPAEAVLRLVFDPADIRIVVEGGREVNAGVPLSVAELPFVEGSVGIRILANRERRGVGERSRSRLQITCESATFSATTDLALELPARRSLAIAVRRSSPEGPAAAPDWTFATTEPTGREPRTPGTDPDRVIEHATVELVALPGAVTSWEIALQNPAEMPRTFKARLHALDPVAALNSRSQRTRLDAWREFCGLVAAGGSLGEPIATLDKLAVESRVAPSAVVFPPPQPPSAPAPEPAVPPQNSSKPPARAVSDLVLVLDETTPGEPPRTFVTRLELRAEHPRNRLQAIATWSAEERLISVRVEPAANGRSLPAEGLRVALETLPPGLTPGSPPLVLRRAATVLMPSRPADVLTAVWQGSELDARAGLAVSVNGYPRAFIFAVDCSPAASGIPQRPQEDFRAVGFAGPRLTVDPLVKAPAESIPIGLVVEAPPDALHAEGPPGAARPRVAVDPVVTLSFRGLRGEAIDDAPQRVWSATDDRQVVFTLDKPQAPAALAVATTVSDFSIAPSGEGYVDIDLEAEAVLAVPGMAASLKATRTFVMDARPPSVEVPPLVNAKIGRTLAIPARVVDDPRESFAAKPGRHVPGVSGVAKVEWALDLKGDGAPEAWSPAVGLGGGRYEIRVDTAKLPAGVRTPLLVRGTDRVGLANPPSRVWIDTAAVAVKGSIVGRVVLKNRGEPNVSVRIDGPSAPQPVRSGTDGRFTFSDLDPGNYTLKAEGPVRNRSYASEATPAVVSPPPAPPASVTLELK